MSKPDKWRDWTADDHVDEVQSLLSATPRTNVMINLARIHVDLAQIKQHQDKQ